MADPKNPLTEPSNSDLISSYVMGVDVPGVNLIEDDRRELFEAITKPNRSAYKTKMDALHDRLSAANPAHVKSINESFGRVFNDVKSIHEKGDINILTGAKQDSTKKPAAKTDLTTQPPPSPGYWNAFNRGIAQGLSQLDRAAANVVGVIPGLGGVSKSIMDRAKEVEKQSNEWYGPEPQYVTEKIAQGLGSGAIDIARHAVGTSRLGPIFGPLATEVITHVDEGPLGVEKAIANTAFMLVGFGVGKKFAGPYVQKLVSMLPKEYAQKLPHNFADLVAGSMGVSATGQATRAIEGQDPSLSSATAEFATGIGIPLTHRASQRLGGKVSSASRGLLRGKETAEPPTATKTAKEPSPSQKYQLEPDDSGVVVDPYSKKSIQLQPNETAYHVGDSTYIITPTEVPGSYRVAEGSSRRQIARVGNVQSPEALALNIHAQRTNLQTVQDQPEKEAGSPKKATSAPPQKPATAPTPPASKEKEQTTPSQTERSGLTYSAKYKNGGTADIQFETESQREMFENIRKYKEQSKGGVHSSDEISNAFNKAVKEYADQYKVSTEDAEKALQGWANSVFYGAEKQVQPGKSTSVRAKGIPPPKTKATPASGAPKAETGKSTEENKTVSETSPPATAAEVESMQAPMVQASAGPVKQSDTPKAVINKPALTQEGNSPSLTVSPSAATPAATEKTATPPVAGLKKTNLPAQEAEVELANQSLETKEGTLTPPITPGAATVSTEAPPTTVEIQPTTKGKYTHRFQGGSTLSFAEPSDLAIAMANPTKQSLSKHAKKLSIITVDGKPILSNPDLAMNLMVSYKKHLLTLPEGNAPTIAEYAERSWPDKGRVAISWPSESSKASEGYSPTTGTLSARETLDRVKFLRNIISTYKTVINGEGSAAEKLAELQEQKKAGKFTADRMNERYVLENDLKTISPEGEINENAKTNLAKSQKELNKILDSDMGKRALALESSVKSEEAAQQQRIKEARERMIARGGPQPVPVIESEAVKPAEGTPAAKLQEQIETGAMPQIEVPTVSNMTELRKKLISAESYIKDKQSVLNIRDTRSTLLKSKIQSLKIELQGAKDYIRDIAKEESKSGKAVSAEEALNRSGKESAELYAAKRKAESIENELNSKKQELQSYEDNQVAKAEQEVAAHLERLKALREQYESVKSKIDKVVEPKEKVKIEERANKSLSEIFNLEAEVNKLRDKFMEGKSEKQSSKTGKAAEKPANEKASQDLIDSTYNEAVAYAKDKGDLSIMDVLNEFKDYGLSNREIRDIYKKLKTDGVLDEKGVYIQKKTETKPTQAVKPEAKPEAKKPKTEEAEKPAAEVVEPPSKAPAGKFSDPADAEMYGIWKKNPNKFGIASPEDASKVAMYRDRLNFKNKAEGNRKIQKYMEYVEEQVNANKQIKSISSWLKEK